MVQEEIRQLAAEEQVSLTHIGDECSHILVHCKLDYAPLIETFCSVNSFLQYEKLTLILVSTGWWCTMVLLC